jgi:Concanavalin A-like lectin/glucanases superfamily/Calcineurin-like phosphoesterase
MSSNAALGTFSLDRLRLGGSSGPENYIYKAGDGIFPGGGVDSRTYYKFVVKDAAGRVRNPSFPCTAAAAFATTDNRYTVQPTDPVSNGTSWKFTLNQYTSSACRGTPSKTLTKKFYVAKATTYADAGLTTQKSAFTTAQTAYLSIAGVKPGLSNWNVTWLLPSGAVACANTGGTDRPESSGTGLLPKPAGSFLQFRPNTTATGSAWNREANYETLLVPSTRESGKQAGLVALYRAAIVAASHSVARWRPSAAIHNVLCPSFGSANAGAWSLRLSFDAEDFVVMPAFTVDTSAPPSPSIDSAPADPSDSGSAGFAFSDSEAGVSFLCQLDGAGFSACTSPKSYGGLGERAHSFQLKARDAAGNESAIVSRGWTVDTTAPLISLTLPANGDTLASSTPTFSGSAGTATGDSGAVTVRIYRGSTTAGLLLQTLSAPRQPDGSYLVGASSSLGNGTYTAQAQQADAAGNLGLSLANIFRVAVATQPANSAPPTISGMAQAGQTLSADPGSWSGTQPISYAYQWQHCPGYPGSVTADAPIAYWRLGEAAGTTAADASGNGNIGSYVAGVQLGAAGALAGDADTGAAFDGIDDRVAVADTAALRLNGSFSIEFWAKLRAAANSFPGILRKGDASSSGTGWFVYYNTTDFRPNFQRAGVAVGRTSAAGALSTAAYKYYALTYDAATSTLRWYVNGALDSTYTGVTFPSTTDPSTIDLGRGSGYGSEFLDEVALYGTALSATRISAHYTAGTQGCSDIADATAQTYTASSADVGWALRVQVTASNSSGAATATSQPTGLPISVGGVAPTNLVPPTISGTVQAGQMLSADPGSWSGTAPISYAYQWQRCDSGVGDCADIEGATGQSYLQVEADVGSTIRVQVTASNSAGSRIVTSDQTAVVDDTNGDPIFVGAGNIADAPAGASGGDEATAELLDAIVSANPGRVTVFTVGDNAYESGTAAEFANYYDPTWGRYKAITRPVPGNHDYLTPGASGYFDYFGAAAGDPTKGYYAYNLAAWRIYALNNEVADFAGSAQEQWLRSDLAANSTTRCVLAYWHEPRFSSGPLGSDTSSQALWQALYDYGADVVVSAHEHNYQRFAPMNASGALDLVNGMREFVVGTGGKPPDYFSGAPIANTEAYNFDTNGVLKLTLHPTSYDFQFVPVAGEWFTDIGSGTCH